MSAARLAELRAEKEELLQRAYWMSPKQAKPRFYRKDDWLAYRQVQKDIDAIQSDSEIDKLIKV